MKKSAKKLEQSRPSTWRMMSMATLFIIFVVSGIYAWKSLAPPPSPVTRIWFFDLNNSQLFAVPQGSRPPLKAPSGPLPEGGLAGVEAVVVHAGDHPRAVLLITSDPDVPGGRLVCDPKDRHWAPEKSQKGEELTQMAVGESARFHRSFPDFP